MSHSTKEGLLEDRSGALSAAFEFTEKRAHDILVPSDKLIAMQEGSTPNDIEMAVTKHGFSRYPMRGESGDLIGYVHIKDLLRLGEDRITQPIPDKRIRAMLTLRDDTDLEDVLARMQGRGVHLARAVDAAGAERGVLFLEDVIEELVGEVHDATKRQRYE